MRRIIFAAAIVLLSTTAALACGKERWSVKTGTDADARQVTTIAQATTIAALAALLPPSHPNARPSSRFAPTELTTFVISGILTVIKREEDEDYHLVIADPNNPRTTMIIESPNPHCAIGSAFADDIASVRQTIDGQFGPIRGRHRLSVPVTVTGVAFFDLLHGQEGVAPNGIELHPILSIQFN